MNRDGIYTVDQLRRLVLTTEKVKSWSEWSLFRECFMSMSQEGQDAILDLTRYLSSQLSKGGPLGSMELIWKTVQFDARKARER